MSYVAVAKQAASAAAKYGPEVLSRANELLKKTTGGKVDNISQLAGYVGTNGARAKVSAEALIRSGVSMDDLFPSELLQSDPKFAQLRAELSALAQSMRARYDQGSDQTLGANDVAADVVRARRVRAALSVFGSEERYFLVNPTGGIPATDFAWYRAMRSVM